ncbi:MAG: nuclear transport factor 2 family protein [Pseudonocardia sp.]
MPSIDEHIRAALLRLLEGAGGDHDLGHEIYADDAVLEFPQSGERFVEKQNFLEWRRRYPADVEFAVRRILGSGELRTVETSVRYDGGEWQYGVSIHEFRDQLMVRETIYWGPGWEAPEWRAPWRATEPETR